MTGPLDGRVAVVTGAAGGIGSGVARRFADEGASLLLTDVQGAGVDAIAQEIRDKGGRATAVEADIAEPAQITAVVAAAIEAYGVVDILANIAQGGLDQHRLLEQATAEQAEYAFRTGPLQSMLFMQECLPVMKERGYGRIINTASGAAVSPTPGFSAYAMAKGAVMSLTRVASQEWARYGITTNRTARWPGTSAAAPRRRRAGRIGDLLGGRPALLGQVESGGTGDRQERVTSTGRRSPPTVGSACSPELPFSGCGGCWWWGCPGRARPPPRGCSRSAWVCLSMRWTRW